MGCTRVDSGIADPTTDLDVGEQIVGRGETTPTQCLATTQDREGETEFSGAHELGVKVRPRRRCPHADAVARNPRDGSDPWSPPRGGRRPRRGSRITECRSRVPARGARTRSASDEPVK